MDYHTLILGKNTDKTAQLMKWFLDDVQRGTGAIFIDFHGVYVDDLLRLIPDHRWQDTILFDLSEKEYPVGFNIFDNIPSDQHDFVASSFKQAIYAVTGYDKANTPTLDQYLYNSARLILDSNETMLGLYFLLTEPKYRDTLVRACDDKIIRRFWSAFNALPEKDQRQEIRSTLSNVQPFITDMSLRNVIGQKHSSFTIKDIMSDRNVLLIKLPRHILGADKARLMGLLILTAIHSAAPSNKTPFYIYIDQAHELVSHLLLRLFTDLHEFGVYSRLTVPQLSFIKDIPLLDSADEILSFRLGVKDSDVLRKTFDIGEPMVDTQLSQLDDGIGKRLRGFNVRKWELEDIEPIDYGNASRIRNRSRTDYSRPRSSVESDIDGFIGRLE